MGLNYTYTTQDLSKFHEDFKIPFAGLRDIYTANVKYDKGDGSDYAELWSSSPNIGNKYYYNYARIFSLNSVVGARTINFDNRAGAFSLRCFKDSYLSFPSGEEECPD